MADPTPPVIVDATPLPASLASLVRQLILLACGWAVAQGWFGQNVTDQLIPIGIAIATVAYGQVKTWLTHSKLAYLANLVPDSQAFVAKK